VNLASALPATTEQARCLPPLPQPGRQLNLYDSMGQPPPSRRPWPPRWSGWPGQAGTPDPPDPRRAIRHTRDNRCQQATLRRGRRIGARSGLDADRPTFDHRRRRGQGHTHVPHYLVISSDQQLGHLVPRQPPGAREGACDRERGGSTAARPGRQARLEDVQKVLTGRGNICPSVDVDEDRQRIPGAARTAALLSHDWEAVTIYGLRGWMGETVDFRYPVIAIAGENGSGRALC